MFLSPLADERYRSLIVSGTIWAFVVGVAGPFFNAYGIESLKMSFADLAYMGIVTSVASMVVFPLVGRMQDRYGDRIVMLVSAACVIPLPIGWILSTPDNLWPLFGTSLGAGLFWPGINQGLANMSMAQSPAQARGAYLATYGAVTGVGVVLSGLAGGVIAQYLRGSEFMVVGYMLNHYSVLFIGSILLRAVAVVFVLRKI
jgi:MFS family permease